MEFRDWQSQKVTKDFYAAVEQRIAQIKEELVFTPSSELEKRQGYVQALYDILDVDFLEES